MRGIQLADRGWPKMIKEFEKAIDADLTKPTPLTI